MIHWENKDYCTEKKWWSHILIHYWFIKSQTNCWKQKDIERCLGVTLLFIIRAMGQMGKSVIDSNLPCSKLEFGFRPRLLLMTRTKVQLQEVCLHKVNQSLICGSLYEPTRKISEHHWVWPNTNKIKANKKNNKGMSEFREIWENENIRRWGQEYKLNSWIFVYLTWK